MDSIEEKNAVIVAGFGRFGQTLARLFKSVNIEATVLDYDIEQIEVLRKLGNKAFYGDASRMDLLRSAGAEQAKLLILAIDDYERTIQIVDEVKIHFPHLKLMVRAYDRIHAYRLVNKGVSHVFIETTGSALMVGQEALTFLGFRAHRAFRMVQSFKKHNDHSIQTLAKVYEKHEDDNYLSVAKSWIQALEETLKNNFQKEMAGEVARGWEKEHRVEENSAL